jgi:hypothetical protein
VSLAVAAAGQAGSPILAFFCIFFCAKCYGDAVDQPAGYLHWGFILISWPNLILIGLMVVLFVLALILPFPGHRPRSEEEKNA